MKVALSFFALFVGWCFTIVGLVCDMVFAPGFHYVTDFDFWLFWPSVFAFVGWLLFVLPAIYLASDQNRWLQFPRMILTGAIYGVLVYLVLVCTWLRLAGLLFVWFPAIMGAVGGAVYSLLYRSQYLKRFPNFSLASLAVAPFAIVLGFSLALWPLTVRYFPYVAYVFGAYESRAEAELQIFKRIHKGQTFAEMHRRYPQIFDEPMLGMSGGNDEFDYNLKFDPSMTYVVEIEISEKRLSKDRRGPKVSN